jgi:hypothetical protein
VSTEELDSFEEELGVAEEELGVAEEELLPEALVAEVIDVELMVSVSEEATSSGP